MAHYVHILTVKHLNNFSFGLWSSWSGFHVLKSIGTNVLWEPVGVDNGGTICWFVSTKLQVITSRVTVVLIFIATRNSGRQFEICRI
jgi:hypothetical protein